MVHGDDFVTLGTAEQISWFHGNMEGAYEVKIRGVLGPEATDDKKIEVLNRTIEWGEDGISYEGDPRRAKAIIKGMGMSQGKAVAAPGVKTKEEDDENEEPDRAEAREFRSLSGGRILWHKTE